MLRPSPLLSTFLHNPNHPPHILDRLPHPTLSPFPLPKPHQPRVQRPLLNTLHPHGHRDREFGRAAGRPLLLLGLGPHHLRVARAAQDGLEREARAPAAVAAVGDDGGGEAGPFVVEEVD